ncbi:unnamed protein product [Tilletia laevis]|uniref:GPI inositol-deacylase n=2 Tax=Tilletia TaxID=13289 RepID=A0A177UG02_9BASI|nr:hypothetical protein CF336_g5207 [Tilletia laevis]KAE8258076.1 hypothetical protein A4X03_0g4488 [Tilletia caries]KAE8197671.1 hypothetical protein CF335_g4558 [Tilletia laevis]CAD6885176.1 unnamed protein product [Tilletia caries]CAD6899748.1 unnamed protein product [Tilletia laevis]
MLLTLLLGSRGRGRARRRGPSRRDVCLALAVGLLSLLAVLGLGRSFVDLASSLGLSQQCRMSRMWPAYAVHHPVSPSGLARKYSLFLYRERGSHGHPQDDRPRGTPALFIPGNAGHYAQIRSVASSSATQYYEDNGASMPKQEWARARGPVDWWTVHFNEDFSAFHSQTMLDQATYVNEVIAYLLELYAPISSHNVTSVPILAHSMGGVVARLLLDQPNYVPGSIDTIITLSTPHAFPPAPFDRGLESIYTRINRPAHLYSRQMLDAGNNATKQEDVWRSFPHFADVLLISIGSGALDTQITSESSSLALGSPSLPALWPSAQAISTFTSALPALWSSVGHVSMAWCDQLRERIARASMMDALLFADAQSRIGVQHTRQRKKLWERILGSNAEWGLDEPDRQLQHSLPLPESSQNIQSADLEGQDSLSFDLLGKNAGPALDIEVITDLAVGNDPTLGLGVVSQPELVILLCKVPSAQASPSNCTMASPPSYELLPPSSFRPTMSAPTQFSPSILFPHAETRYELPGQGLRRWRASVAELRASGYSSVKVSKLSNARGSGWFRAGWTPSAPIVVTPKSAQNPAGALSSVRLDIADALSQHPSGSDIGPVVRFLVPSMDSSLLAYRLVVNMEFASSDSPPISSTLAFSPMLHARHRGTGDAVWFPSLLEAQERNGGAISPSAHNDRLRMSLYASSPFIAPASSAQQGTLFSLFFDPSALKASSGRDKNATPQIGGLHSITVQIDWMASLGLLAMRYRFAALVFPFAMLCLIAGLIWDDWNSPSDSESKARSEDGDIETALEKVPFPALLSSLWIYGPRVLLILSIASMVLALLQAAVVKMSSAQDAYDQGMLNWLLGYPGPASFSFIALGPVLLLSTFSILVVQVVFLVGLVRVLTMLTAPFTGRSSASGDAGEGRKGNVEVVGYSRTTLLAIGTVIVAIFFLIPYQLAFLIATMVQLLNAVRASATWSRERRQAGSSAHGRITADLSDSASRYHQQMLVLALMMGVLPIRAPVLVVWARNVLLGIRAPATTPGLGDHNVLEIVSFILFVQVGTSGRLLQRAPSRMLARITQLLFSFVAIKSLTWGLRYTYLLYDGLNIIFAWLLFVQWRTRKLGASSSTTAGPSSHDYTLLRQRGDYDGIEENAAQARAENGQDAAVHSATAGPSALQARHSRPGPSPALYDESAAAPPQIIKANNSAPILRMDIPAELSASTVLPPSLAASADLSNPRSKPTTTMRTPHENLDDLLKRYLDLAATYHALRTRSAKHFAQGHIDLVRARMQVGGWNLAKLGKDGWDARLAAQTQVRAVWVNKEREGQEEESSRLLGFETFTPRPSTDEGDEEKEGVQPYLIDEDDAPAVLRHRRKPKATSDDATAAETDKDGGNKHQEDEDKKEKEKKDGNGDDKKAKRPPLPPDPLYQFAALPPPSLRSAKSHFEKALSLSIGGSGSGSQTADNSHQPDIISVVLEMAQLSDAIDSARRTIEQ